MLSKIINNHFIPLRLRNIRFGHIITLFVMMFIIALHIALTPIETTTDDLYRSAYAEFHRIIKTEKNDSEADFNMRSNNLWVNLLYYKQYIQSLKEYFGVQVNKIPNPKYPLISVKLKKYFNGRQILPPINFMEIALFLRKNLGSGITIRTKNKKIGEHSVEQLSRDQVIDLLNSYNVNLKKNFKILIEGNLKGKPIKESYLVSFKNFTQVFQNVQRLIKAKVKFRKIAMYHNEEVKRFFNPHQKENEKSEKDKDKDKKKDKDKDKKKDKKRKVKKKEPEPLYSENLLGLDAKTIFTKIRDYNEKTARIYTIIIHGRKGDQDFEKKFIVRFEHFPLFSDLLRKAFYDDVSFKKILIYESKVLKHRANSREIVDFNHIQEKIRKAYILVEDDYFYFQAGSIDPIGLTKASYNYLKHGSKKGNASIMEQVYEMYLGSSRKGPIEKLYQILGAVLISYYTGDRTPYVNLYVQSIPGSFWRDHNYGLKGIIKTYLNKDSFNDLTIKELAWLTKIAFSPNEIGQDYVRFHLIKNKLKSYKVDIFDEKEVRKFLKKNSEEKKAFIRLPKEAKANKSDYEVLQKLIKSYRATNKKVKIALKEFLKGNELIDPLITKKEYDQALKEEIELYPPTFLNQYQSYTDQTRKDLYKLAHGRTVKAVGKELKVDFQNAGLDFEVAFDEKAQMNLERELLHSTRIVYKFRYEPTEYKRYGGASILVKTNNLKTGKIENKIVAMASKHTKKNYFNWAVDGQRHFGSIYKWMALLLYLDNRGTLLDNLYDIPRVIKYKGLDENGNVVLKKGKPEYSDYTPDNWHLHREDTYGFFTYEKQHNIYNFIQSKNNTFVKIAELVGIEKFAAFLNELAELKAAHPRVRFQARYPIVLGSQELSSVKFAQLSAVIANKGIFKPLTTINQLIEQDGSAYPLIVTERQVVTREAAEAALYCGYINTFLGTAKRFVQGGVGKTGSSDTDVSFLAMTARTKDEYIKERPEHILNSNLIYLVNIGVNVGKIDDGLFGGTLGALNAKEVFEKLLEFRYVGKKKKPRYPISGDFKKYFSKKFDYKAVPGYVVKGKTIKAPVLIGRPTYTEEILTDDEIATIRAEYEARIDEMTDPLLKEQAQAQGVSIGTLLRRNRANESESQRAKREDKVTKRKQKDNKEIEDSYFDELRQDEAITKNDKAPEYDSQEEFVIKTERDYEDERNMQSFLKGSKNDR